ncbi:NHS-like protein 3 [Chanos chanos]|uniref:NHS-like protein 3 n=1 Tax=Chanos chanos TaxID=29144 RepID=A0A6J2WLZ8_CHACN|nr:uncharacterized protein KIAA1522 homolog [Chanos chanos]
MSKNTSTGDLVPRDITEILAQQNRSNKSKKKRGSSLGRAFSWLRGTKRKRSFSNGLSRAGQGVRPAESSISKQVQPNQEPSKAGTKQDEQRKLTVHYSASSHYQENVFIEGSRPQYLEDLHTEAQEGLRILQQEEHKNGVDFQDDQTIVKKDATNRETDGSLESGNTAFNSVISATTASVVSSRSMLMRQGSTFKPLNTVKRLDKTGRRSRRTTIMGIPHQVQRELGMGKGASIQQLQNGEEHVSHGVVVIPTIDGEMPPVNHEGARIHLQDIEALHNAREEQLLRHHIQSVYRDDLALHRKIGPRMCLTQRPKSLAVPGMTSSSLLQEPHGPVMSISPQATYLSKIIPNAILPAAVDVIKIDRSRSRGSVRTVSKSSLASASPASSRSGEGSNGDPPTTRSNWSQSQSSDTVVSNSSTISSKATAQSQPASNCNKEVTDLNIGDQVSLGSSTSWMSCTKKYNQETERGCDSAGELNDAHECIRDSRAFSRSLSVMKTKLPPAPPTRTYSLHPEKLKRRSRELVDIKDFSDLGHSEQQIGMDMCNAKTDTASSNNTKNLVHASVSSSTDDSQSSPITSQASPDQGSSTDQIESFNSSPQKTSSNGSTFIRTLSPSSGYSSQSATPTLSPKDISPSSPGKLRVKPPKPERTGTRTSPVVSVSSSTTSLSSATSDSVHQDIQSKRTLSQPAKTCSHVTMVKNTVTPVHSSVTLGELFNIPPPPKVKAPSPPPPETWAHNKHTFELLCGPGPNTNRLYQLLRQQQKGVLTMQKQETLTIHSAELVSSQKKTPLEKNALSLSEKQEIVSDDHSEPAPVLAHQQIDKTTTETIVLNDSESSIIHKAENESPEIPMEEINNTQLKPEHKYLDNLETNQENLVMPKTKQSPTKLKESMPSQTIHIYVSLESNSCATLTENNNAGDETVTECATKKISNSQQSSTHTLSVGVPELNGISPPPSPPPAHHPPPPPSKKSPTSSIVTQSPEQEDSSIVESSWPPPPPPMEDSSDLVFEGQDEQEFPPPPPPFMQDSLSHTMESCTGESEDEALKGESKLCEVHEVTKQSVLPINLPKTIQEQVTLAEDTPVDPTTKVKEIKPADPSPSKPCNNFSQVSVNQGHIVPLETSSSLHEVRPLLEEVPPLPHEAPPNPPTVTTLNVPDPSTNHQTSCTALEPSIQVPVAPPAPTEDQFTINFRRASSSASKEGRNKELLSRNKSSPIPKEDANIPLVTPSLLQMVRLRSVSVGEDPTKVLSKDAAPSTEEISLTGHVIPQKPIRKSLCIKSTPPSIKSTPVTVTAPSMCLQEAIRMKTAAMSPKDGLSARLNLRSSLSSTASSEVPSPSPKSSEGGELLKSPTSTASFIFSRSTKKVVIETPTSPEAQASLKQSLAAELMQVSDQAKLMTANGTKKSVKLPPPVAKKPAHGTNRPDKPGITTAATMGNSSSEILSSPPEGVISEMGVWSIED